MKSYLTYDTSVVGLGIIKLFKINFFLYLFFFFLVPEHFSSLAFKYKLTAQTGASNFLKTPQLSWQAITQTVTAQTNFLNGLFEMGIDKQFLQVKYFGTRNANP